MASRQVRALVYARLPLWVDYLQHGYLPGQGDGIPSGNRPGSRLPAPDWLFDLSRAFAALNPATTFIIHQGRTHWSTHAPLTPAQHALWLYYTGADAPPPDTTAADRFQWQHERERARERALKAHDSARDALVAASLHVAPWKARRLRAEAVWAIATFVNWDAHEAD